MGNCVTKKLDRTVTLRPAQLRDVESLEYSKSLASPGNGLTSPKQRFARRTSAHKGVMSSIAMKFPHIKRSFMACKRVFEEHADPHSQTIPKSAVSAVLLELGAKPEGLSKGTVEGIIEKANLDGDDVIDFKEFLIAAAVGCFLRADPETEDLSACFLSIRKGFEAAKEAFGKIDKDGSGEIEFEELKEAFLAMKEDDLILERLKELDFNGDSAIEFPEFVWGLSAWVGMDEHHDDDIDSLPPLSLDAPPKQAMDHGDALQHGQRQIEEVEVERDGDGDRDGDRDGEGDRDGNGDGNEDEEVKGGDIEAVPQSKEEMQSEDQRGDDVEEEVNE